jgi:hypothetical protein
MVWMLHHQGQRSLSVLGATVFQDPTVHRGCWSVDEDSSILGYDIV